MANKVYVAPETALVFKGSGGDAVITLNNLAAAAGGTTIRWPWQHRRQRRMAGAR